MILEKLFGMNKTKKKGTKRYYSKCADAIGRDPQKSTAHGSESEQRSREAKRHRIALAQCRKVFNESNAAQKLIVVVVVVRIDHAHQERQTANITYRCVVQTIKANKQQRRQPSLVLFSASLAHLQSSINVQSSQ